MKKSEVLVVYVFKSVGYNVCDVVYYYEDTGVYGTYIQGVEKYGVLSVCYQKSNIYVSGTYEVGVNGESVSFYLKLHLVKGIVCGSAEDSGDI